ncbi:hypothetical protein V5O48_002158 [Marasmius crinis-equi]|uniref:Uncharacterized protein n=1 Tax=Marasmius crinis-equi TaxID=585013 RepID=A0ABR3FWH3_9AGAR
MGSQDNTTAITINGTSTFGELHPRGVGLEALECLVSPRVVHLFLPLFTNLKDLFALSRAHPSSYRAIDDYLASEHADIDRILRLFFSPNGISALRKLQLSKNFLISGSTVNQCLFKTIFPGADLDIYVDWFNTRDVASFLVGRGWTFIPDGSVEPGLDELEAPLTREVELATNRRRQYFMGSLLGVLTFSKRVQHPAMKEKVTRIIQVISCSESAIDAVLGFHSSAVVNFISATHIFCLFPRSTLLLKINVAFDRSRHDVSSTQRGLTKYSNRGWPLVTSHILGNLVSRAHEWQSYRYVGDTGCYIRALKGVEVHSEHVLAKHRNWLANSFDIKGLDSPNGLSIHRLTRGKCHWTNVVTYATILDAQRPHTPFGPLDCSFCRSDPITKSGEWLMVRRVIDSALGLGLRKRLPPVQAADGAHEEQA